MKIVKRDGRIVEYDSEKTRYPFEFSFKDKELFLKFFKPL